MLNRLARLLLAGALAAQLTGCAGVERIVPTGEPGPVPEGWAFWCMRNPDDPSCRRPAP